MIVRFFKRGEPRVRAGTARDGDRFSILGAATVAVCVVVGLYLGGQYAITTIPAQSRLTVWTVAIALFSFGVGAATGRPIRTALIGGVSSASRERPITHRAAIVAAIVVPAIFQTWYAVWLAGFGDTPGVAWAGKFPSPTWVVGALMVCLLIPIFEEYLFRWVLLSAFSRIVGSPVLGVVVVSVWFAIGHEPSAMPPAFVVSLASGALVLLTGSIRTSVLAHGLSNAAVACAAVILTR